MAKSVGKVVEVLQTANTDTTAYNNALTDFSAKIVADGGIGAPVLIAQLLQKTYETQEQNGRLRDELELSCREIDKLRENLEIVRHEAATDGLTNVGNRKYFDVKLSEMTDKAMKIGDPLCLLMFDVDHFKAFNDAHGHQTGDQVLRLVARTLKESVKGRDVVARYGGEEFAVILSGIGLQDAIKIGDGIRKLVAQRRIIRKNTGEVIDAITISVGVALHRPGEPLNALIERSDAALYKAKNSGRNRVLPEVMPGDITINQ